MTHFEKLLDKLAPEEAVKEVAQRTRETYGELIVTGGKAEATEIRKESME